MKKLTKKEKDALFKRLAKSIPIEKKPFKSDELIKMAEKLANEMIKETKTFGEAIMLSNMARAIVEHNVARQINTVSDTKIALERGLIESMKAKKTDRTDYIG